MTIRLETVGDSKSLLIPQALIQRYHLGAEVEVTETATGFLLEPAGTKKLTMEESFAEMANDPKTKEEAKLWEGTLEDGLEDDEFKGWPR